MLTEKGNVEIAIMDRGTGIPVDDLDRIFEPFMTTKSHGLGLGLSICRSIVEAHGGRLWATNNSHGGATLRCELPATRTRPMEEPPTPTVYVVDDEPDLRGPSSACWRRPECAWPRSVRRSIPGPLHRDEPGCLVLDLAMPGLNGLDLQRVLEQRAVALPIIFLTGRGDIAASVQAMKHGAADFLTKPVNDVELIAAIHVALATDRQRRRGSAEREHVAKCLASLTERERQVLEQIVAGRLNKQIAADLGTVEKTIKFHRGNLMRKMGVRVVADLVRLAERAGIGAPPDR